MRRRVYNCTGVTNYNPDAGNGAGVELISVCKQDLFVCRAVAVMQNGNTRLAAGARIIVARTTKYHCGLDGGQREVHKTQGSRRSDTDVAT